MTPDEQEAHSLRYGQKPFLLLPLRSGRFAVIADDRSALTLCATIDEAVKVGTNCRPARREPTRVAGPARSDSLPSIDLSKLGLI